MLNPKAGLLPLYLKLYDEAAPEAMAQFEPFIKTVVDGLVGEGIDIVRGEVCRVEAQCQAAVDRFEQEGVDLIVTLHLAYSPSLESAQVLSCSDLPILMLDTTMDHDFGPGVEPDRIMFNHGIHGVQDLASMLRRKGKAYEIVAGHVTESDVLERAANVARAAHAARLLRKTRALRIGASFQGMGDFAVPESLMRDAFGIHVDEIGTDVLAEEAAALSDAEVREEMRRDGERFAVDVPAKVHERSVRVGLGLRRFLDKGAYTAFSMSFLAFQDAEGPVNAVPFLEASKAMARGLGYAGEGDVLTASLVGALNGAFGRTTFTEIFCPDWKGGALFLSHMGEINPLVAAAKPRLHEKPFPYTPALNPAVLTCAVAPGPAVLVNLAPGPDDAFDLIIAPVEVLGDTEVPAMRDVVRAWIRPACPLEEFLEQYSRFGGTHHSALVLGDRIEAITAFAAFAGIPCRTLEG